MHHITLNVEELNDSNDLIRLPRANHVWVRELLFLVFFGKEESVFSPEEFII